MMLRNSLGETIIMSGFLVGEEREGPECILFLKLKMSGSEWGKEINNTRLKKGIPGCRVACERWSGPENRL